MSTSIRGDINVQEITVEKIEKFFDSLIEKIKEDKKKMTLGIMDSKEREEMYEKMIKGDLTAMRDNQYKMLSSNICLDMIRDYVNLLSSNNTLPNKLAFSIAPTDVNVFAIINDGEKEKLNGLLLSEGTIFNKYYSKGFTISSNIFEVSDNIDMPKTYLEFPLK